MVYLYMCRKMPKSCYQVLGRIRSVAMNCSIVGFRKKGRMGMLARLGRTVKGPNAPSVGALRKGNLSEAREMVQDRRSVKAVVQSLEDRNVCRSHRSMKAKVSQNTGIAP